MGVSYEFRDSATNAKVPLFEIDRELASHMPDAPDSYKFPSTYDQSSHESISMFVLFSIGLAATKTGTWDEAAFRRLAEEEGTGDVTFSFITPEVARLFLNGKYTFRCWC